jgi:predicted esterase
VPELGFVHVYQPPREREPTTAAPREMTLLLLHGTGGTEHDLLPLAPMLAPDAGVLSPRGQVLERGMPRFFRRLAEGVFDLDDLKQRTEDLADFVEAAADRYRFDLRHVVAVGFSNGANIAASVLLLRPGVLSGGILLRAMVPLVPERLPSLDGTPVLISNAREDPLVDPAQTGQLAELLRRAGADVTLAWQQGGHSLAPNDITVAKQWLSERWMR